MGVSPALSARGGAHSVLAFPELGRPAPTEQVLEALNSKALFPVTGKERLVKLWGNA